MSHLARIEALTSRLKNVREKSKQGVKIGTSAAITVTGGGAAGALEAKMPTLPNTNVSTAGALGAAGVFAAMSGFLDEHSDHLGNFAGGMLAFVVGKETEKYCS